MCVHLRIFRNDKNLNYQFNFFFNLKNKIIFLIVRRFYYSVPRASGVHKGMQRVISLWSLEIINRWLIAAKIIDWWILLDLIAKTKLESPKKTRVEWFYRKSFRKYRTICFLIREIDDILLYLVRLSMTIFQAFSSAHVLFIAITRDLIFN